MPVFESVRQYASKQILLLAIVKTQFLCVWQKISRKAVQILWNHANGLFLLTLPMHTNAYTRTLAGKA